MLRLRVIRIGIKINISSTYKTIQDTWQNIYGSLDKQSDTAESKQHTVTYFERIWKFLNYLHAHSVVYGLLSNTVNAISSCPIIFHMIFYGLL